MLSHSHEIISDVKKQSAYVLTAIQVTGAASLPILNSSIQLYHQYGFHKALVILFFGNILIWLMAYLIVLMTANTTKNTLQNAEDYVGRFGSYTVGIVLIASTVAWFILQTNLATEIILHLWPLEKGTHINTFIQVGVGLGVISTIASMEGIKGLRWISCISFPVLMLTYAIFLFFIPTFPTVNQTIQTSIGSLTIALGSSLSVAVDYPTFFQHSKSKRNSILALTAIQTITFLVGIGGLFLGEYITSTLNLEGWDVIFKSILPVRVLFFILVVFSCISTNMVNIYSASIAWELVVPVLAGRKEYMILGLGLTSAFVLMINLFPMEVLVIVTDVSLSNLCLVLVLAYVGKIVLGQKIEKIDKIFYFLGWLIGCIIIQIGGLRTPIDVGILSAGFLTTIAIVISTMLLRKGIFHLKKSN